MLFPFHKKKDGCCFVSVDQGHMGNGRRRKIKSRKKVSKEIGLC